LNIPVNEISRILKNDDKSELLKNRNIKISVKTKS
jgi:hypothetical protein